MSGSENRRMTRHIMVRTTPDQLAMLQEKALDCGVSVPEYLRLCGLGRRTRSHVDAHVVNELRRLGGLQKHLFKEGHGVLSKEYAGILVEIRAAIARIDPS